MQYSARILSRHTVLGHALENQVFRTFGHSMGSLTGLISRLKSAYLNEAKIGFLTDASKSAHICATDHTTRSFAS